MWRFILEEFAVRRRCMSSTRKTGGARADDTFTDTDNPEILKAHALGIVVVVAPVCSRCVDQPRQMARCFTVQ